MCFQFSTNSVFSLSPPVTFVPVPFTPLIDPFCHNSLRRYQINARTEMALRYNDISPLENHHCAVAFQIFSQPDCNIFFNFDPEAFKQIRQVLMCSCRNRSIVWVNTCTTMAKIIILLFDETLHKIFNRCFILPLKTFALLLFLINFSVKADEVLGLQDSFCLDQ